MWSRRRFLSSGLGWQQFRMAKLSHLLMFIVWLALKEFNVTGLYFQAGFLGGTRQVSSSEKYLWHICKLWRLENRLWDWRIQRPFTLSMWVVSQRSNGWCPSPAPLFHAWLEERGAVGKTGGRSLLICLISPAKLHLSHVVFSKLCLQSSNLISAF